MVARQISPSCHPPPRPLSLKANNSDSGCCVAYHPIPNPYAQAAFKTNFLNSVVPFLVFFKGAIIQQRHQFAD